MIEIVHAIAPGAQLFFATANGGPAQMANNIISLRNIGCDIIVDDYTYFNESPFEDGFKSEAGYIGQAVTEVSQSGGLYFSSARNSGNLNHKTSGTWEGDFNDGGPAGPEFVAAGINARIHIFANARTLDTIDRAGEDDRLDLFWADPLGGSTNGYDLFVVNAAGQVINSSTTSQTGTQDPYQSIPQIHQGESVVIVKTGAAEPRFLHLDSGRAQLRFQTSGSVRGHNANGAENAFSVAATKVPLPAAAFTGGPAESVEVFSSDGPRRVFFTPDGAPLTPGNFSASGGAVLRKPDVTAADGVSTSLPNTSGLNPFFGTSAAAPHAAAIAALLLSCNPRPTPAQIRTAFRSSARPIEGSGLNDTAGYGIVMARAAAGTWCNGAPRTN
jgi:subtilisin family serine protease